MTHSEGQPTATAIWAIAKAEVPTTPPWDFMLHQSASDHKPLCPPPRFVEIAQTLQGEEPIESGQMLVIASILYEEVIRLI